MEKELPEIPCPFCNGTGKYRREDPRCPKCRGAGYTGLIKGGGITTRVYCDCPMGTDLARVDQRLADEKAWDLAQQPGIARPADTTTSRLKAVLQGVRYRPDDDEEDS